jgi:hypothetical protein
VDPLVFVMGIVEKKTPEAIEKEAIRKLYNFPRRNI